MRAFKRALDSLGRRLKRSVAEGAQAVEAPADIPAEDRRLIAEVMPYTMTGPERVFHLIESMRYLQANAIGGAIVECGVWRGGSMMACAKTLVALGDCTRELFLFDTFEGMPPPAAVDVRYDGESAKAILESQPRSDENAYWAVAPLEAVRENMRATGYPMDKVHFVRGRVEETLPAAAPAAIALLRLDTDWYESTRHELQHLYPRLARAGVLIIDDYGWWQGARAATDEFLAGLATRPLLHRLDFVARACVKP
jgi:O-methyltransferase